MARIDPVYEPAEDTAPALALLSCDRRAAAHCLGRLTTENCIQENAKGAGERIEILH